MIFVPADSSNGAVPRPPKPQHQQQPPLPRKPDQPQQLFDLIGQPQQRASSVAPSAASAVQMLPGLNKAKQPEILQRLSVATGQDDQFPDESFFEMLMKCQGSRIEEQRSSLPSSSSAANNRIIGEEAANVVVEDHPPAINQGVPLEAPTVPDEDFFNLIQRLQSGRLEDQRASLPK